VRKEKSGQSKVTKQIYALRFYRKNFILLLEQLNKVCRIIWSLQSLEKPKFIIATGNLILSIFRET